MTKKQKLEKLRQWKDAHDKLEDAFNTLFAAGFTHENPLFEAAWAMFTNYSLTLSDLLDDDSIHSWVDWYHSENGMGSKGLEAGYDGEIKPIKTLDDLLWLIEEGNNRK